MRVASLVHPSLLKYFPLALAALVLAIYFIFLLFIYILESERTLALNLPRDPAGQHFRLQRDIQHLHALLRHVSHVSIRPRLRAAGLPKRDGGRGSESALLQSLQDPKARAVSPLFEVQGVRAQHGPPLPVDSQLHRVIQQEVLQSNFDLGELWHVECDPFGSQQRWDHLLEPDGLG